MERSCYFQAYETFRDGVFALKACTHPNHRTNSSSSSDSVQSRNRSTLVNMLGQAHERLLEPQPSGFVMDLKIVSHDVPVTTHDFLPPPHSPVVLRSSEGPPPPPFLLLRINTKDVNFMSPHHYPGEGGKTDVGTTGTGAGGGCLPFSILLYNMSVAYLCRAAATASTDPDRAQDLYRDATRLLITSRNLLASQCYCRRPTRRNHHTDEAEEEEAASTPSSSCIVDASTTTFLTRVLFVSSVLLRTLMYTHRACGQVDDAQFCWQALQRLHTAAVTLEHERDNMSTTASTTHSSAGVVATTGSTDATTTTPSTSSMDNGDESSSTSSNNNTASDRITAFFQHIKAAAAA